MLEAFANLPIDIQTILNLGYFNVYNAILVSLTYPTPTLLLCFPHGTAPIFLNSFSLSLFVSSFLNNSAPG